MHTFPTVPDEPAPITEAPPVAAGRLIVPTFPWRLGAGRRHPAWLRAVADDTGSATAEYAIATMAAVGFAGLLVVILRGDEVKSMLTDLIHRALTVAG